MGGQHLPWVLLQTPKQYKGQELFDKMKAGKYHWLLLVYKCTEI